MRHLIISHPFRSIALVSLAIWLGPVPAIGQPPTPVDRVVKDLVAEHNKERAKEKLPPLTLEAKLTEAARIQAQDMADHEKMQHEGSDGSVPKDRIIRVGYRFLSTGENVAYGYRDVKEVMRGWMESPPHKMNIMGDYTEIGVAVVRAKDGKPYWAAEFGRPMPQVDVDAAPLDLVKRLNEERVLGKLPELTVDPLLAKAAKEKATALAEKKSQGGETANFDGINQKLYADLALSTGGGNPDAASMLKSLLDNPDTKKQVLGQFAKIGTGYATSEDGIPYWCLILANPARR